MQQDYFNKHLKSNNCKKNCIDEGFPFCANADYSGGYCCMPGNDCPRNPTKLVNGKRVKMPNLHCSDFWPPGTPNGMRYFVCPNEAECGTRDLYPQFAELLTRAVEKYTDQFVLNDVCSYVVHPPAEMTKWDKLYLRIDKI